MATYSREQLVNYMVKQASAFRFGRSALEALAGKGGLVASAREVAAAKALKAGGTGAAGKSLVELAAERSAEKALPLGAMSRKPAGSLVGLAGQNKMMPFVNAPTRSAAGQSAFGTPGTFFVDSSGTATKGLVPPTRF